MNNISEIIERLLSAKRSDVPAIKNELKDALADSTPITSKVPEIADLVFNRAWEESHAVDIRSIDVYYDEISEMIEVSINAYNRYLQALRS